MARSRSARSSLSLGGSPSSAGRKPALACAVSPVITFSRTVRPANRPTPRRGGGGGAPVEPRARVVEGGQAGEQADPRQGAGDAEARQLVRSQALQDVAAPAQRPLGRAREAADDVEQGRLA